MMTREEAKNLLPIIQAWVEGKTIQVWTNDTWVDEEYPCFFEELSQFRIKPEPRYRPFESQEECWHEMLKHQPFGWVKSKKSDRHFSIGLAEWDDEFNDVFVTFACDGTLGRSSKDMFEDFTFADGTPFGKREE